MTERRLLIILKPDALERRLVGEILSRYEKIGLGVVNIKFVDKASDEILRIHYPDELAETLGRKSRNAGSLVTNLKEFGKIILEWNRKYMKKGSIIAMVLEGEATISAREITGYTDPSKAKKGTIRGDLGTDSILKANNERRAVENLVHVSGNLEEAKKEIELWFPAITKKEEAKNERTN